MAEETGGKAYESALPGHWFVEIKVKGGKKLRTHSAGWTILDKNEAIVFYPPSNDDQLAGAK